MTRKPDFERLKRNLYCEKADAVPLAELFHDLEVMDSFLGREANTTEDRIEFYAGAGYDYIPVSMAKWFSGVPSREEETIQARSHRAGRKNRIVFSQKESKTGLVSTREEFCRYDWSHHGWLRGGGDLSYLNHLAQLMPEGMKLIAWSDGIFEFFSKFIGYERFCFALHDDGDFIEEVFREVGRRAVKAYERVARHPAVGAVWLADDIGYSEGLLWEPGLMRRHLFPWYKEIGRIARQNGKPFIFHSDGRLWDVVPDLLDAGVNALQPIEPKSWDPLAIKKRYGNRLCIMGTIDLDLLCRGTGDQVMRMVKKHIDLLGADGGFVVGTSNTPTWYMNQGNFKAMLDTALEYGGHRQAG
jgi:uroporphyrinogen decarboxylase